MDISIALDGHGRLGHPGAVGALARAADRLDYRSVWCLGPWATTLAGAVAAVTTRVRIGLEARPSTGEAELDGLAAGRLVVGELGPICPTSSMVAAVDGRVRLDVEVGRIGVGRIGADRVGVGPIGVASESLDAARRLDVTEVVVHLLGDPTLDEALATFAELAALADRR